MRVQFWFDPACPFCWMTSRWVVAIAPERALEIEWRPISLLLKNDPSPDSPYFATLVRTHQYLRVVEAARAAGAADRVGDLYTELGRRIHHEERHDFDLVPVLEQVGLDPSLASALDDETWDEPIRASMADGLGLTGDDVGTPLIAIERRDGERMGAFGPVLTSYPDGDEGLRLWDGFVALVASPGFHELKRAREGGPELPPLPPATG